jgi:hypothetical protein
VVITGLQEPARIPAPVLISCAPQELTATYAGHRSPIKGAIRTGSERRQRRFERGPRPGPLLMAAISQCERHPTFDT